jgi:hypothetical protein
MAASGKGLDYALGPVKIAQTSSLRTPEQNLTHPSVILAHCLSNSSPQTY